MHIAWLQGENAETHDLLLAETIYTIFQAAVLRALGAHHRVVQTRWLPGPLPRSSVALSAGPILS